MLRQLALFLVAVQFLTRIPVPNIRDFQPDWTARAARYFPLVGAGVGLASAAALVGASLIWGGAAPALVAVVVSILVTGAFHEDGLADTFDGLGGGREKERRLEIMKDSRVGTFGVLGLGLVTALKVAAIEDLPVWIGALAILSAQGLGRSAAVLAMRTLPYAGDRAWTKVKPVAEGVTTAEAAVALTFGLLALAPLAWTAPLAAVAGLAVGALAGLIMAGTARRLIGGWVGDTLGAIEQLFEMAFLMAVAGALAR